MTIVYFRINLLIFISFIFSNLSFSKSIDLSEALQIAINSHPIIASAKANLNIEKQSISPLYFPDNPMIGIMRQNEMKFLTFSQEFLFPSKYYYKANSQAKKASMAYEEVKTKKLEIRQKVVSSFYSLLAKNKNLENLEAQKDLLREIARIAEGRRAIGQVTAQDEMKAHLEQSKIENEILSAKQDIEESKATIEVLLGSNDLYEIKMIEPPTLKIPSADLKNIQATNSNEIKIATLQIDEANALKNLSKNNFLPDFKFTYQRSIEKDNNDKTIGLEFKIPLWFFGKETNDYSAAVSKGIVAEKNYETTLRQIQFDQKSLIAKIIAKEKILELYKTTLIPQSKSTIISSRSAYQAGKVGLMEVLDSERSFYNFQISYYQELKEFAEAIAEFESKLNQSISSLPFIDVNTQTQQALEG